MTSLNQTEIDLMASNPYTEEIRKDFGKLERKLHRDIKKDKDNESIIGEYIIKIFIDSYEANLMATKDQSVKGNKSTLLETHLLAAFHFISKKQRKAFKDALRKAEDLGQKYSTLKNSWESLIILFKALKNFYEYSEKIKPLDGEATKNMKKHLWSACFGPSLSLSLLKKNIIRNTHVLIQGETGTGKELAANVILHSSFWAKPGHESTPVLRNINEIPKELLSSELFGYTKGAFTGADKNRDGLIKEADGCAIFLDEIGDLSIEAQVKLLRVIENQSIQKMGTNKTEKIEVRFIFATHKDLDKLVRDGKFRQDLLERIKGITIELVPLRDRKDEIWPIAESYLDSLKDSGEWLTNDAKEWIESNREYDWPGNIRELKRHLNSRLLGIEPQLKNSISQSKSSNSKPEPEAEITSDIEKIFNLELSEEELKQWYLKRALEKNDGSKKKAAAQLGIDAATLHRRLKAMS